MAPSSSALTDKYAALPPGVPRAWAQDVQNSEPTFGKPFSFGSKMQFSRPPPDHIPGTQWHALSYLDPARLWLPSRQQNDSRQPTRQQAVKATVVSHARASGQEQLPPPEQVTVSKGLSQPASALWVSKVAGVAVREYGTVLPLGADGSYRVFERLDYAEAKRRAPDAAAAMKRLRSHVWQQQGEETGAEASGPVAPPVVGPAFTMGSRTRPSLPGQTLVPSGVETVPGPGQYEVAGNGPSGPAFTLGRRVREKVQEDLPGPGQYADGAGLSSVGDGPAFTIPGRASERVEEVPGPGDYEVPRSIATGPAVTITGRPRAPAVDVLPGPADYQKLGAAGREAPAYTILGRPDPRPRPGSPAPGEYELPEAWRSGVAFSMGSRPQARAVDDSPGPGDYLVGGYEDSGEGPAFTMARRPKAPEVPDSPGPGEYYRPPGPSAPAFTLGAKLVSDRQELEASLLPGPGMYSAPDSPGGPAYTFRARPPEAAEKPAAPGPGAYQVPGLQEGPAFTIASKPPAVEAPPSPGPGAYHAEGPLDSGPAFTMGTRPQERDRAAELPAPGDYTLQRDTWNQGPAFTMRQQQPAPKPPDSPGPGEYVAPPAPRGPAFTMPGRLSVRDPHEDLPGPGAYGAADELADRGPAFTIGARPGDRDAPPSPGPGDYHHALLSGQDAPAFTMRGRGAAPEAPGSPIGPGAYNPEQLPSGPAFTMRPKTTLQEQPGAEGPGPGAYSDAELPQGPAWTMAGPGRPPPAPDSPGPTHYNAAGPGPGGEGPAFTMRPRTRDARAAPGPGPGEYSAVGEGGGGPAFTIRGRPKDPAAPMSPGPGEHQKLLRSSGPAFSMPGRPANWLKEEEKVSEEDRIPPPGSYGNPNVPGKEQIGLSGPAFTLRPRLAAQERSEGPGPGEYMAPGSPNGPAYTLGARLPLAALQAKVGIPGPGEYGSPGPATGQGGPAFSLLGRVKPAKKSNEDGPAPGDYGAPQPLVAGGPAFTLGGKRKDAVPRSKALEPGPGEHQRAHAGPSGPAFSMGRKLKPRRTKKSSGPDPGQYFQPSAAHGAAHTFPLSPRMHRPASDTLPGPDQYDDPRDLHTSPAWTMAAKPQPQDVQDGPGPGAYHDSSATRLHGVASSLLRRRRDPHTATSFGYADLYGAHGGDPSLKRVTFDTTTRFWDSMELSALPGLGDRSEDVRRLPADSSAAAGGRRELVAGRRAAGQARGSNRAQDTVAVAVERAAAALAAARLGIEAAAPPARRRDPTPTAAAARRPGMGAAPVAEAGGVRYETRLGEGGSLFTLAVPSGPAAAAGTAERGLVSAYMSGGREGPAGSALGGAAVPGLKPAAKPSGRRAPAQVMTSKPVEGPGGAMQQARRSMQYLAQL